MYCQSNIHTDYQMTLIQFHLILPLNDHVSVYGDISSGVIFFTVLFSAVVCLSSMNESLQYLFIKLSHNSSFNSFCFTKTTDSFQVYELYSCEKGSSPHQYVFTSR